MTQLIRYDAACKALAAAKRVDEAKSIKDKAEALRAYARQAKNPQLEADAWEIRKRAEDKLGELSAALDKAPGQGGHQRQAHPGSGKRLKTQALKAAGISTSAANRYEQFSRLPAHEKERRIAQGRAAIEAGKSIADKIITQGDKADRRAERERELGSKLLTLPDQPQAVIVEDYEWDQQVWSRETGMDRHAANHYPVSEAAHTPEEIVERTRDRFACAADDCALFMWATVPHLAIAIDVLRLRGFRYVSNWTWDKIKIATGYWNRNRHEHLLLGIKGTIPCPAPGEQWESLFSIKATEHSAKPEHFLEMIESYFPTLPKIELNRRGPPRPGWSAWGFETTQSVEAAE